MPRHAQALLLVAWVSVASAESPPAFVPAGYRLVWRDEFDGRQLDTTKWQHAFTGWERNEARFDPSCAELDGAGHLRLRVQMADGELRCGRVSTQALFEQRYGYFEARLQPQASAGLRGAWWLMSTGMGRSENPSTAGAEVMIMAYLGDAHGDRRLAQGVYWNAYKGTRPTYVTNEDRSVTTETPPALQVSGATIDLARRVPGAARGLSADFHVLGLTWTPDRYVFHIDGRETFRTHRGVSRRGQFMQLALMPEDPHERGREVPTLPAEMRVDYVRVYAMEEEAAPPSREEAP